MRNAHSIIGMFALIGFFVATGCSRRGEFDGGSDTLSLGGTRLSEGEVAGYLSSAGFPRDVISKMVCTAKNESSFYTGATNRNVDGSQDTGLFQINDIHVGTTCDATRASLMDPMTNARCALKIYRIQGINAWYGYQGHRSECDNYHAVSVASIRSGSSGGESSAGSCDNDALQECLRFGGGNACYSRSGCTAASTATSGTNVATSGSEAIEPAASCNRSDLDVCLRYGGGNACYTRSGCTR